MALKLYKTVFWISFAIMVVGAGVSVNRIRLNFSTPTTEQVLMSRTKAESPFYSKPLVSPVDKDDFDSIRFDYENHPIKSLLYYENGNVSNLLVFVLQFLMIIGLKKWVTWLVQKPQA